jgi:hypothetical protein
VYTLQGQYARCRGIDRCLASFGLLSDDATCRAVC